MRAIDRLFILIVCGLIAGPVLADDLDVDIPSQPVGDALNQFAEQSGLQVVMYAGDAEGVETEAVQGTFEAPAEVLDTLLASTGLEYVFINDRTVSVSSVADDPRGDSDAGNVRPTPVSMVQNQTAMQQMTSSSSDEAEEAEEKEEELQWIDEIVVTGTNIRGASVGASPVLSFDRTDIDASGFATTGQFLRSLPTNFGGGVSEITVGGITGGADSRGGEGSSPNLRGLGVGTTLVLINGRRFVPSGADEVVDVSLIPTTAIRRIDILTDGASAVYGSDAIGGVVNIILNDDFVGAETRLRTGTTTQGGGSEFRLGQSLGADWGSGHGFVSYEWYSRDELDAQDREFSSAALEPFDLLPDQERQSLFATAQQSVSERLSVNALGTYSTRRSEADRSFPDTFGGADTFQRIVDDFEQFSLSAGLAYAIGDDWQAEAGAIYGETQVDGSTTTNGAPASVFERKNSLTNVNVIISGPLFGLPGGDVLVAFGGEYRDEAIDSVNQVSSSVLDSSREVSAGFAELEVPIIGDGNRVPGVDELAITGAVRFEDYTGFGSASSPKFGVVWRPTDGVKLRSTWGTSFRAPLFAELDDSFGEINGLGPFPPLFFADPESPTGFSGLVWQLGGNAELGPEEATTWTVGFDITDLPINGLTFSSTYYSIEYEDQITNPPAAVSIPQAFLFEDILGPLFRRVDDPEEQQAIFGTIVNNFGITPEQIDAFFDARTQNLSITEQSGIDFDLRYDNELGSGTLGVFISGTYILERQTAFSPTSDFVETVDTIFNPTDLRFQTGAAWSNSDITLSGVLNYTDGYTNDVGENEQNVDAWITLDLNIRLDLGEIIQGTGFDEGTTLRFSAINVLDEDPPFVDVPQSLLFPLGYDGANANPLGRLVALELVKRW